MCGSSLDFNRAIGNAPPLDPGAFAREYPRFCNARRVWPDERTLAVSGDNRAVDLYRLHAAVRAEGGMDAVTQKALWGVISAQLGFVDYPATAAGPAKSGPGTAEAVKAVFVDYLDEFDEVCVAEWQRRRSGRRRSPQRQIHAPSFDVTPPPEEDGVWRTSRESGVPTVAPPPVEILSTSDNFTPEMHDPYGLEPVSGREEFSLAASGFWASSRPGSPVNRVQDDALSATALLSLHPPTWDFDSALTLSLAGWRPPDWPPCGLEVDQRVDDKDQEYGTALRFLARANCAAANASAIMDRLLHLVTPERYSQAQRYVTLYKHDRLLATRANALTPVPIPEQELPRYYDVFNRMWTIIQCLDAQLALHALWFVADEGLKRTIDMLVLVQEQLALLELPDPCFVLDFRTLLYCTAMLENHFVDIENMLTAVFSSAAGVYASQDSPVTLASGSNSDTLSISQSPTPDVPQNGTLVFKVVQARRIIESYKARWLRSFEAAGRRILPVADCPPEQAAMYSSAWQELLAQATEMDKRLAVYVAADYKWHMSAEKIAYIISAVFEQQRVLLTEAPEYILSLDLVLRFTNALQAFSREVHADNLPGQLVDCSATALFTGAAVAPAAATMGPWRTHGAAHYSAESSPTSPTTRSPLPASSSIFNGNSHSTVAAGERVAHAEAQTVLLHRSLTRPLQVLLQVPHLLGSDDAVYEWDAIWADMLLARETLAPLIIPYLASTGDPIGTQDMVQILVNVDEQQQLMLASDEPRRVVCRTQLREWLRGCERSTAIARAGIASGDPTLVSRWPGRIVEGSVDLYER